MGRGLTLFAIQILSSIAFFLATVIVARYLGPEDFGDFSAAYSVASVAYIVCLLGADVTAVNIIAKSVKAQQNGQIKAFILYAFCVVTFSTVAYYIIAIIGYWASENIFMFKNLHPVFIAVIFIPIMALAFFFYRVFISLFKPILANVLFKILVNLSMLFLACLMFFDEIFRTSYIAILFFMIPWLIAFIVMLTLLVWKVRVFASKREEIRYKTWLKSGLSGLPYNLALMTIPYLAIIGAEVFLANESSVGIFATAASFSQLVANNFIACIQSLTLAPIVVAIYNKDLLGVRNIFNKNLIIMGGLSILLILGVSLVGKDILEVYGKGYVVGDDILIIFIIMQCVIMTGCLAAPTLLYLGKNIFVVSSSMILIVLLVLFISIFGFIFQEAGIAVGVLLAVTLIFVTQSLYAYKLTFESSQ
ncbi:hypothetical protein LO80_05245 [Candidatus Francisella endociliophora]|uniref:Polysaccharide biosynthesis protein n=1 Tax=Candidatus Francisella endociliophora TaxID=653937 RepID=A0A097EPC9_9GAMM|nr:oligosaccharide flippase family protein [Francisella sp. FSC1006]AIT09426.1 hypothetical protein LO80_05245 [Francisella sp. FSC1006]